MKHLLSLMTLFLLAAAAGPAIAQEAIPWNDTAHIKQFKYFQEQQTQDRESWAALTPEEQKQELEQETLIKASNDRHEQVVGFYNGAMEKWDAEQMRDSLAEVNDQDVKAVSLWLGEERGAALKRKLSTLRGLAQKSGQAGLDEADLTALAPYLKPDAIAGMKGTKLAADSVKKPEAVAKDKTGLEPSKSGKELGKFAGTDPSKLSAEKFAKLYDGSAAGKDSEEPSSGVKLSAKRSGGAGAQTVEAQAQRSLKTASIPTPSVSVQEGNKSTAWTSDAYGVTLETSEGTKTFRKTGDADAAIRKLPPGSVTKVTFYGHGSPGMQMVGEGSYDSATAVDLLKGKMAKGGVIQFTGCNTSSIGGATLNPAVGISMVARRLLYFSLPYFQDRADGIPAAQASQQWEKEWNSDLAGDTSLGVKGAIVCGYRTFGLVPGRLPGLTRLMGNQEATTPGYVAGKKVCFRDGVEVPAP